MDRLRRRPLRRSGLAIAPEDALDFGEQLFRSLSDLERRKGASFWLAATSYASWRGHSAAFGGFLASAGDFVEDSLEETSRFDSIEMKTNNKRQQREHENSSESSHYFYYIQKFLSLSFHSALIVIYGGTLDLEPLGWYRFVS